MATGPYHEEFVDGGGHHVQQDSADNVNRILLEFLICKRIGVHW